eukprot:TRINITY_DN57717_c0_g1_i1.p1 TRINITY_DN57717_c0_g1~~TRINITY_DN57717_c0_g1_i1.p1  ORF type:complete len:366 (-),score=46.32 TRINITY_DN57717_c0_g1_i1:120-1193(-)
MEKLSVALTLTLFGLSCQLLSASYESKKGCGVDEDVVDVVSLLQTTLSLSRADRQSGVREESTELFNSTSVPYKEYAADRSEVSDLPEELSQGQLLAYNPTHPENSDLFLFLPGSWVGCNDYSQLLETIGASMKTLCLPYDNIKSITEICGQDSACWYEKRKEAVSGRFEQVDSNNIVLRLQSALEYMTRKHGEDWGAFLSGASLPKFERMRVSGHSQGSGVAAMLAYQNSVARVVQFSGPCDPSDWPQILHSNTPSSRFFAMASSGDHIMCDWKQKQIPIWIMEGMVSTERPAAIFDEQNLTSYDPASSQAVISFIKPPLKTLVGLVKDSHDSTALNMWDAGSPYADGLWQKLVGI